jgi:hypothetical protein
MFALLESGKFWTAVVLGCGLSVGLVGCSDGKKAAEDAAAKAAAVEKAAKAG